MILLPVHSETWNLLLKISPIAWSKASEGSNIQGLRSETSVKRQWTPSLVRIMHREGWRVHHSERSQPGKGNSKTYALMQQKAQPDTELRQRPSRWHPNPLCISQPYPFEMQGKSCSYKPKYVMGICKFWRCLVLGVNAIPPQETCEGAK